MSLSEIINKIEVAQIALTRGNTEIKTLGTKKAEAKRNYAIALNKKDIAIKSGEVSSNTYTRHGKRRRECCST